MWLRFSSFARLGLHTALAPANFGEDDNLTLLSLLTGGPLRIPKHVQLVVGFYFRPARHLLALLGSIFFSHGLA